MYRYNKNIPEGTRDILFEEAQIYDEIERKLTAVYESEGFSKIITPAVEYYDTFDHPGRSIQQEEMYKLTDSRGRLAVLRADNTTPTARVIATKLKNAPLPLKLYYNQNVHRICEGYTGRRSEIFQNGVEFAGAAGERADIICIVTAVKALRSLGLNFKVEIGHVGYCGALINELGMSEEETFTVREYINSKNTVALNFLKTGADFGKIRRLPSLFGGSEIFGKARELAGTNKEALAALDSVINMYDILSSAGYGDDILVDLGIAHSMEYYTGIVFRGYIDGVGEPILGGGRYDNLIGNFDYDIPATGFAINMCLAADAIMKKVAGVSGKSGKKYLIHFDATSFAKALKFQKSLIADNKTAHLSAFETERETAEHAFSAGYDAVAVVGAGEVKIIYTEGSAV
jgi:ATP phosphoribosyltransferase, regulatory subunit